MYNQEITKPIINFILKQGVSGKSKAIFSRSVPKSHWLDYAEEKSGAKIVTDTKTIVNMLVLYLPLPIYWCVYVQQGSRWIFQAVRMDGDLGFYTVKPDQMIIFNSIMGILMVPVCDYALYPLLEKIRLNSNLQKMTIGGVLGGVAFLISAFVEIKIQTSFISIFWLVPQYLVLAISEIFLFISTVSFSYSEAPASMKSAMQAFTFITIALGNAIVAVISGSNIFSSLSNELFFFSGVLFVNQIIFGVLASRYKYSSESSKKVLIEKPIDQ